MEIQPIIKDKPLRLKRSEVTKHYRISRWTLIKLAKLGKLKPVGRITEGGETVYETSDVEAYQKSLL